MHITAMMTGCCGSDSDSYGISVGDGGIEMKTTFLHCCVTRCRISNPHDVMCGF